MDGHKYKYREKGKNVRRGKERGKKEGTDHLQQGKGKRRRHEMGEMRKISQ